jgi:hypothetical protein
MSILCKGVFNFKFNLIISTLDLKIKTKMFCLPIPVCWWMPILCQIWRQAVHERLPCTPEQGRLSLPGQHEGLPLLQEHWHLLLHQKSLPLHQILVMCFPWQGDNLKFDQWKETICHNLLLIQFIYIKVIWSESHKAFKIM